MLSWGLTKLVAEINADHILAGLGDDWEPLYLALMPTLDSMLLLNQEAKPDHHKSLRSTPPFCGLNGGVVGFVHVLIGRG